MAKREKTPTFEAALEELENVVGRIERGELSLEESIAAFDRGMHLVQSLGKRLAEIETRVETMLASYEGASEGAGDAEIEDDDG